MTLTPIKTGILSYGMSGKVFHAPFLNLHPGFELTAVVERHDKSAGQFYPNIQSYNRVEDLLNDPNLDLVVVNTPNNTHSDYVLKALEAGKHVLVEKPFATDSAVAKVLFEEARKRNLCLLPYQNRRYDTDFQSVKTVVESGMLGNLVEVHFRFDRYRPEIGPKNFKENPIPGSGLLFDLGPHLLDQIIALFGKPDKWTKTLCHFREQTQVDDYFHLQLSYPNGMQVYVTASMLTVDAPPAFQLFGSKGTYFKKRTDPQEAQLIGGMTPDNAQYGCESVGDEGQLWLVDNAGSKHMEQTKLSNATYMQLFEYIYQTIRLGKAYPIREEDILLQLRMLCG
jgi:scyllo-inositol 2-dehydrogenase (NADP+)